MSQKFISKKKNILLKKYLYVLAINISSLYLFFKITENVVENGLVTKLDMLINGKIVLLWDSLQNKIMIFITNIGSQNNLLILLLILFGVLVYKKKWHYSLLLLFSMIGGVILTVLTKIIIHRARPENALIEVSGYSSPSGHATMAILFFSLLIYLFKDTLKSKTARYSFIIGNIMLFLGIGFSRIYLNVHWLSDVIGGFLLGLFWLTLLLLIFKIITSFSKKT